MRFLFACALLWRLVSADVLSAEWTQGSGFRSMKVAPSGRAAGFTLMTNSASGLVFTNRLSDELLMQNVNVMQGSGVALGDFDGDGRVDLYFCAIDGSNRLYRNLGDWKFEDVTAIAGLGCTNWHSTGACFADLDGDGKLDLLISTLGRGVHSFIGNGRGGFRETTAEAGLATNTGSMTLALGDVDGDGDLDLYVANYGEQAILRSSNGRVGVKKEGDKWIVTGPHANRLRYIDGRLEEVGEPDVLYLNDGAGHFRAAPWNSEFFLDENGAPMAEPFDFGLGAQIRDINEDGFPDIYVCNDFKSPDRAWINDGKGHFRLWPRVATRHQSYSSMGVDFADIDRDGRLDFFVVEMLSRDHGRRLREGAGIDFPASRPGQIEDRPEINRNNLYWNRGDGTYAEIANFSGVEASEWSWQPVFLDVDLDGFEDLLVVNGNAYNVQDRDGLARVQALGRQTPEESRSNIFRFPKLHTPNVAFRNRGNLTFEEIGAAWGFASTNISQGIALADLDGDGDLDVVVNCLDAAPLLYRNDSTAPRVAVRLRGKAPNIQGIGAKVTVSAPGLPSQKQEIIAGGRYLSGDDPMRVFAATNRISIEVAWRNGTHSTLTNLEPNQIVEIDETSAQPAPATVARPHVTPLFTDISARLNHAHFENLFDDFAQQPLLSKRLSQSGPGLAWFDIDRDGNEDLVVGAGRGGRFAVFRGDGKGGFRNAIPTNAPALPDDLTSFAGWVVNGRPVLLGALSRFENPNLKAVLLAFDWNPDAKEVVGGPVPDINAALGATGPIAVADIEGDGDLDVFVGGSAIPGSYPKAGPSRIYRQDNGKLILDEGNTAAVMRAGLVNGAVWSDLNGDGKPDLILACEWGPVRVYLSQSGQLFDATANLGLDKFTGWWQGVSVGDFDGDGRMDIVASNWGFNDAYKPTSGHPIGLYYGNLSGTNHIDLIESEFDPKIGAEVPHRGLSALGPAIPALNEAFATHEAFGAATIDQILKLLPPAEKLEAATLASVVFLNRGDHFEIQMLPIEAQLAPAFSANVADLNGDGFEDLFLSQNFFATRPDWPRSDSGRGLWLRGNGRGQFKAMTGEESGIIAYGEQRGAALADFDNDGRVDVALSQNGSQTLLFQNTSAKPGLRVHLEGPIGNSSGYGAIIRLEFETGLGPAREIHAGSGYRSQDGAIAILATPSTPKALHVTWPGGTKHRLAVPLGAKELTVSFTGQVH